MLDTQVIGRSSRHLPLTLENPYERLFERHAAREAARNPYAIPSTHRGNSEPAARASLLSGLAAVVLTVTLFASGVAVLVTPATAKAPAERVILL